MGRKIDKIALWLILAAGSTAFFLWATDDLRASLALAFLLCLLVRAMVTRLDGFFGQRRREKRRRHRLARDEVRSWTFLSEEEAQTQAERLFPGQRVLLLRLPEESPLEAKDVLRLTEDAPGDVTVATTGKISDGARMFAASVTNRRIRLLDEDALSDALAKSGAELHEKQTKVLKKRLLSVLYAKSVNRKNAPRQAVYGALLMGMYLIVGVKLYLPAALMLLLLAGLGFRPARPA